MTKVVHIVIVKFKPEVTEEVKQQAIRDVIALKEVIPEIINCSAGTTYTDRSKGYEHGWVVELEKEEHLPLYAEHPSHLDFVKQYKPLFADLIALDYVY
ncbi:hypothetical protein J3Q64DRAFT_1751849 [Phycomyces blakesleeanus]|uniref:Stress-response A/B barrel domain-containing protein n=2 Tax=Phycomyces blakesleeanus TaxID=4837 RepID=A0A162U1R8_PHYB8|nr:hypothetical protein PHYBLDRAFT_181615 [Phycomyces blakesleeanus NRRL 1555(-)]OAD72782.1 hypothetical protein PHYBLDRAFT_181615 [Phycomyces blakesleeanus NRRL 1555(-)]|eukprot:XP_018290822.1 hypothetical protein PHYBLDRAFT_181615 [Phycomyces blakesleeanus NRRL 1555(-)]